MTIHELEASGKSKHDAEQIILTILAPENRLTMEERYVVNSPHLGGLAGPCKYQGSVTGDHGHLLN